MREPASASVLLELEEAKSARARLHAQVAQRMHQLDELWTKCKPADRMLAIQRLLQAGGLNVDDSDALEQSNERCRDLYAAARAERKRLEQLVAENSPAADADLKHRAMRMDLDHQRAERERDELITARGLRTVLYVNGESFIRTTPFTPADPPLRDLVHREKFYDARVAELEQDPQLRRGARFTTTDDRGNERTLIRMLPALTLTGEGDNEPVQ